MAANEQLIIALGYCALLFILALIFQKFPPKKINWYYGYRTQRSMKNDTIWKAANTFSINHMIKVCTLSFLLPVLLYFLYDTYLLIITIVVHTLLILSVFLYTEMYLDKHFNSDGTAK
ncbi:MAG: SdpI family protein [Bacteroidota bacterium]